MSEKTDEERAAEAKYRREYNARVKGTETGKPGRKIIAECGTISAYKRHMRHDEEVCDPCRRAWNSYQRELYKRRRPKK